MKARYSAIFRVDVEDGNDDGRCRCTLCSSILDLSPKYSTTYTSEDEETVSTATPTPVVMVENDALRIRLRQSFEYEADYWRTRLGHVQ